MSIVKVDSIPFQFDFTGGCNCCNCKGRKTVYVNSHLEIEPFDAKKSTDHDLDYLKSLQRIRQGIQNLLELQRPDCLSEAVESLLAPLKDVTQIQLRHIKSINRNLCELWDAMVDRAKRR